MPATPRRRRRQVEVGEAQTNNMDTLVIDAFAAKVAADKAARAFTEAKEALKLEMERQSKNDHLVEAVGDRPAISCKMMQKTTNVIDPAKFRKLVTPDEFAEAVGVVAKEAKKVLTENQLTDITTSSKSNPYVEIKAKGGGK